ncbi:MAG: hypothetical protein L0Y71_05505 [Gemmataceae bacterium]|nr:hypothetical protein [Gemmataceae bacterium]
MAERLGAALDVVFERRDSGYWGEYFLHRDQDSEIRIYRNQDPMHEPRADPAAERFFEPAYSAFAVLTEARGHPELLSRWRAAVAMLFPDAPLIPEKYDGEQAVPRDGPASGGVVEEWLKSILRRIAGGTLLPAAAFAELDRDASLDARDHDKEFEARWVRLSEEIKCRWAAANVAEDLRALAEDIRRESFLAVSRATTQHEIASYVSDDFDLIVRGKLLALEDPFLDQLWRAYDDGRFPRPHDQHEPHNPRPR